jgi:hypothetical protein
VPANDCDCHINGPEMLWCTCCGLCPKCCRCDEPYEPEPRRYEDLNPLPDCDPCDRETKGVL